MSKAFRENRNASFYTVTTGKCKGEKRLFGMAGALRVLQGFGQFGMFGQNFLHGFAAYALSPLLALALQFAHEFRKDLKGFVSERRSVKLRESLDFLVGKILVVHGNGHIHELLRLRLGVKLGKEKIDQLFPVVSSRERSHQH